MLWVPRYCLLVSMLQCKENVHANLPRQTNARIGEQLGSDCTLNSHKFVQVIEQHVDTFLMYLCSWEAGKGKEWIIFLKRKESENNKLGYLIYNIVRKLFCGLLHIPSITKIAVKSEAKRSWTHLIGLKSMRTYLFITVASSEPQSAGFERKMLVWYFCKLLDPDNKFCHLWNEAWILTSWRLWTIFEWIL